MQQKRKKNIFHHRLHHHHFLHLSAILYFLDKWETELAWTVLPHSLTLDATIFEAILTGKSFNFFKSNALELALIFVVLNLLIAECSEIRGNLILGIRSSSSYTVSKLLLIVGSPSNFLLIRDDNLFKRVTTTSLIYSVSHYYTFLFLIDFKS